jgi:hypothetical protein
MGSHQLTIGDLLDEVLIVIGRRAVAGEDAMIPIDRGW